MTCSNCQGHDKNELMQGNAIWFKQNGATTLMKKFTNQGKVKNHDNTLSNTMAKINYCSTKKINGKTNSNFHRNYPVTKKETRTISIHSNFPHFTQHFTAVKI